jgi:tRNA(Arg) A34 adenosine deaminase TadA
MDEAARFVRRCYRLAEKAALRGDHPFGALLAHQGEVLLVALNKVNTLHDKTAHAESNLIRMACRRFSPDILAGCVLYTSTEPCAMCAGAIYWSGISTVVYGCSAQKMGETLGDSDFLIPCTAIFEHGKRPITVVGPVLEEEGIEIHRMFW